MAYYISQKNKNTSIYICWQILVGCQTWKLSTLGEEREVKRFWNKSEAHVSLNLQTHLKVPPVWKWNMYENGSFRETNPSIWTALHFCALEDWLHHLTWLLKLTDLLHQVELEVLGVLDIRIPGKSAINQSMLIFFFKRQNKFSKQSLLKRRMEIIF